MSEKTNFPKSFCCPFCESNLVLEDEEITRNFLHCPACGRVIIPSDLKEKSAMQTTRRFNFLSLLGKIIIIEGLILFAGGILVLVTGILVTDFDQFLLGLGVTFGSTLVIAIGQVMCSYAAIEATGRRTNILLELILNRLK